MESIEENMLEAVLFGAGAIGAAGAGVYSSNQDVTSDGDCLDAEAGVGAGEVVLDVGWVFGITSVFFSFNEALKIFFFLVAAAPFLGLADLPSFLRKAARNDSDLVNKAEFFELIGGILELLATSTAGVDVNVVEAPDDFFAAPPVITFFFLMISLISSVK